MTLPAGPGPDQSQASSDAQDLASVLEAAATLGGALRTARERSGKSLAELAAETKVHRRFLTALEQNDWSSLPSRVFALGYVRAYAAALGLDAQSAIERFKRESPDTTTPLKPPVGIAFEDVRRQSPRIAAGIAVVVLAVIGWNVFQRVSLLRAPPASDIAAVPDSWRARNDAPIALGAPKAAPPDQTTPALYVTPGLEAQLAGIDPNDPEAMAALAAAKDQGPVQKAFNPRGPVYGAPANASQVVIQARKPGALVVRLGENQALFARQMAAGESWRAPLGLAATIDVSDPAVFDVYLNGEYDGPLPAVLTPLAQLNARAGQAARQLAESQARAQAEAQSRIQAQAPAQAVVGGAGSTSPTPTTPPSPVSAPN